RARKLNDLSSSFHGASQFGKDGTPTRFAGMLASTPLVMLSASSMAVGMKIRDMRMAASAAAAAAACLSPIMLVNTVLERVGLWEAEGGAELEGTEVLASAGAASPGVPPAASSGAGPVGTAGAALAPPPLVSK